MIVDSYLELFTTLFGWLWYSSIWYVLRDSGMILLPFVGIVLDHFLEYRKGFEDGDAEELTVKGLEVDLFLALFVVVIAGSPVMPLDATELSYTPPSLFPSLEVLPGATVADSGSTFGSMSFQDYPETVEVPLWWYGVNKISSGFNHAIMESIPPQTSLRHYTEQLRIASIEDPALRQETNAFFRDCFTPARSKFLRDKPDSPALTALLAEYGDDDPHWMGSHVFLTLGGYYDSLRAAELTPPFLYSALRDTEWDVTDPDLPTYGKPTCAEWWSSGGIGLKSKLIDSVGVLDSMAGVVEAGWSTEKRHDTLIKNLLSNGPSEWTPRGYDYAYTNTHDSESAGSAVVENAIKEIGGLAASAIEAAKNSINITVFLNASPHFQALLLMFVYAFLPFVLLLSRFSLTGVLTATWAIFTIKFFTVLWMMVWWVDQNLISSMYPNVGDLTKFSNINYDVTGFDKRLLLSYLMTLLYYGAPLLFLIISAWGGYKAIGGMNAFMSGMTSNLRSSANNVKKVATKGKGK